MQPTQQFVIPFNFWQGNFAAGEYELAFDTDEDFIIASISASIATESSSPVLQIGTPEGGLFWADRINEAGLEFPPTEVQTPTIVVPQPASLTLTIGTGGLIVSVDGYRIGPSAGGS